MTSRVFITGGASGLGKSLATQLARQGAKVCIGDSNVELGQQTAAGLDIGHFISCDVRNPDDLQSAADWMRKMWGGVDLVINNAGVAQMGSLETTSDDDWQWILDINIKGVVHSTRIFAPIFRSQGGGKFLNIASMAGLVHLPNAAAYNATKAAVIAISETMMLELEADGISTHIACPAFFRTDLAKNMRASDPEVERVTTRLVERSRMGADDVAELILQGLQKGETHIFTHSLSERTWLFKRVLRFSKYLAILKKQLAHMDERMKQPTKSDR